MARVPVDGLQAGMTVASDLRDPLGRLLVAAGTVLTDRRSAILRKGSIEAVRFVTGDHESDPAVSPERRAAARSEIEDRFRRTDLGQPFVSEPFELIAERGARQLAGG